MKRFSVLGCGLLALVVALPLRAADAPAPNEAQIQKLIVELGSDDFDVRENAEKSLKAAGTAAIPAIKKAMEGGDAELRARSQRILEELAWSVLPPVASMPAALPPNTIFVVHTPGLKAAVQKLRSETAAGKLYDRSELAAVKEILKADITGRMSDEERKFADTWLDRFGGLSGIAFMNIFSDKEWPNREQAVACFGILDPDPAKAWADFNLRLPLVRGGMQLGIERHRGIEVLFQNWEGRREGRARVLNLAVHSVDSSADAVKRVVDLLGAEKSARLSGTPAYTETAAKLDPAALALLYFNFTELAEQAGNQFSPRERKEMEGLGFMTLKHLGVSLGTQGELLAERAWVKLEGERKGLAKLLSFAPMAVRHAPLAPPDALGFVTLPLDGKVFFDTVTSIAREVNPQGDKDILREIAQLDEAFGIKIVDDLIAPLQGEHAVWVQKPAGALPVPDLAAAFEARDDAAAKKLAETFAKLIGPLSGLPDAVGKADFKGRACFWLKKEALKGELPYTFSWCADGRRLLVSSSQEGLQALVNRIDNKAAGLDAAEDFKKLFEAVPATERGGLVYLNTAELGGWGLPLVLPMLAQGAPPEIQEKLNAALKDPKALLKGFPGTLFAMASAPDGLQARAVGGLPASAKVVLVPVLAFQIAMRRMAFEMEKQAAIEAQKAQEQAVEAKTENQDEPKK